MTKKREGAKMGRPPVKAEDRREVCAIRMTRKERATIMAEAHRAGITLSDVLMRPWRKG